jgi:hypothetical protein
MQVFHTPRSNSALSIFPHFIPAPFLASLSVWHFHSSYFMVDYGKAHDMETMKENLHCKSLLEHKLWSCFIHVCLFVIRRCKFGSHPDSTTWMWNCKQLDSIDEHSYDSIWGYECSWIQLFKGKQVDVNNHKVSTLTTPPCIIVPSGLFSNFFPGRQGTSSVGLQSNQVGCKFIEWWPCNEQYWQLLIPSVHPFYLNVWRTKYANSYKNPAWTKTTHMTYLRWMLLSFYSR